MSLTLALRERRQVDLREFDINMVYTVNSRLARDT